MMWMVMMLEGGWESNLLLVLLGVVTASSGSGGGGTLALDTTSTGTTVGRGEGKVNVLLRVETDNERGDVDDLLADADVALDDQDTGVVDRLGETALEDLGLETTLKEVLDLEGEHVIETHAGLVEHTNAHKTADNGVTLEETLGVLLVELEELTSGTSDLGEGEGNAPDLTLVAKTVLTSELKLTVETGRLERSSGNLGGLGLLARSTRHLVYKDESKKEMVRWKNRAGNREVSKADLTVLPICACEGQSS